MNILGIGDSISSGAALIVDGQIAAAVNEERLNRQKMCMGFPRSSVDEVTRIADTAPGDIDAVAVATNSLFWRPDCWPYTDYFRENRGGFLRETLLSGGGAISTIFGNSSMARNAYHALKSVLTRDRRGKVRQVLDKEYGIKAPVHFIDHHLSHAASAYFTSGFDNATVITLDGAGDGKSSQIGRAHV